MDIDVILKAWAYFIHHTLDTNQSGYDIIAERALELYLFLTYHLVNIGMIIYGDMDEISQSPKKLLGHAIVIPMLCQKAGVANLDDKQMVKPTRPLDPVWLKDNIMAREDHNSTVRATRQPQVLRSLCRRAISPTLWSLSAPLDKDYDPTGRTSSSIAAYTESSRIHVPYLRFCALGTCD
ncbi:hypothetical protein KIW84_010910 [Lathyrus oleraceus]|uniref:Uncharacterized protein n=1 Tax=Pisum sativum TaxID=3888 RepID=A0A9D4YMG2_PEA|nr:hypothetical protein KIW84_010910 [Pisum sativum]